ncbi:MAG: helix-turn-helix transcriptional regulator [Nitrospira sp.]|jgi:DNA-binding transcriptional regulator YiaG|nr:helix-turn-helix transcriptional regulator [Nitrospira sp.]
MAKLPKLRFSEPEEIRDFRRKHQMNQLEFWKRVGVTQSGGSRYESGRNIPRPVQLLLTLVYGTDMQVEKLSVALHDWKKKEG